MSYRVALLIAAASMLGFAGAAYAESVTVTKAVQDACAWEYDKFCNQYGLGSELLDICFKQNAWPRWARWPVPWATSSTIY